MLKNEEGMTLVEVLATLILLTLVTGIIWTTVSISLQFNLSETTELELQKEANYIISRLQQTHRKCHSYELDVTEEKILVENCVKENGENYPEYNGVVSNEFKYNPVEKKKVEPTNLKDGDLKLNLTLSGRIINENREPRKLNIETTISRYKTNDDPDG